MDDCFDECFPEDFLDAGNNYYKSLKIQHYNRKQGTWQASCVLFYRPIPEFQEEAKGKISSDFIQQFYSISN